MNCRMRNTPKAEQPRQEQPRQGVDQPGVRHEDEQRDEGDHCQDEQRPHDEGEQRLLARKSSMASA